MSEINETLQQRGRQYGDFSEGARVMQDLKAVLRTGRNWDSLGREKKEALEMIVHKIGRILNGDPNHRDSWHDIGGYARLIEDTLEKAEREAEPGAGLDRAVQAAINEERSIKERLNRLKDQPGVGIDWNQVEELNQ